MKILLSIFCTNDKLKYKQLCLPEFVKFKVTWEICLLCHSPFISQSAQGEMITA